MNRPSLFRSLALGLTPALASVALASAGVLIWLIVMPVNQRAVSDLAALMLLSAQTWVELPPDTRPVFELELLEAHGLLLTDVEEQLPSAESRRRYVTWLSAEISQRLGQPVRVQTSLDPEWHWADIPLAAETIRIGFAHERIGTSPVTAAVLLLLLIVLASVLAALVMARGFARPLETLAAAAQRVGAGQTPEPLPEAGPRELAELARRFNRMAADVRETMRNRTTLLSGISHDLRTPLARMRLALEMLPANTDSELINALQRDVEDMERLIALFLEIGRGLAQNREEDIKLVSWLASLAQDAAPDRLALELDAGDEVICRGDPQALERILSNLVDNARRYGGDAAPVLRLRGHGPSAQISVLDRGPGIPESEHERVFEPFYRLEGSRSQETGGSGLGLAIARQLAAANGWTLSIRRREGGGTEAQLICKTETWNASGGLG